MNAGSSRLFAIIPAAGLSRRMGQPKLLLPLGGRTVIARVLSALSLPNIAARCVVVRKDDHELKAAVEASGGLCISPPADPPDMRTSVKFALQEIQQRYRPTDDDGWMLIPADHPVVSQNLISSLIEVWTARSPSILVPRCGDRRGHPTLFRWSLVAEVANIPDDCGLNWLLKANATDVSELLTDDDSALIDLDTPAEYDRLKRILAVSDEEIEPESHEPFIDNRS